MTCLTVAIDVKIDGSVPEEKSYFKMLGLTFYSKLDWGSYIISIAETASKKIEALIHSMKFLSSCFFPLYLPYVNLPYGHAWNTIVMSRLVLLVAIRNYLLRYKNGYAGLLVLYFLPLLNPWHILESSQLKPFLLVLLW